MSATLPNPDAFINAPAARAALGHALVVAIRTLTRHMEGDDPRLSFRACVEVLRLANGCMRHGHGLPLDWACDEDEPERPVRPRRDDAAKAPVTDLPSDGSANPTAEEWGEFVGLVRGMGFDEEAIALAGGSRGLRRAGQDAILVTGSQGPGWWFPRC